MPFKPFTKANTTAGKGHSGPFTSAHTVPHGSPKPNPQGKPSGKNALRVPKPSGAGPAGSNGYF